ncbi:MAG: MFS transporter [Cellvibrionales bacterium]
MQLIDDIRARPMSLFQTRAVLICILINFIDGFDVLAIAFAAPEIAIEWSLQPAVLGVVFSAGLAGMVVGALFLSPFADRYGRRTLILTGLVIISIGMFTSALANDVTTLVITRLITGLGVGGMLSSLTTMVSEYSNARRQKLAVAVLQSGYPVGAIIAGFVSVALVSAMGWRSIFVVGGGLSLLMLLVVWWRLPESLAFLLSKRPPRALDNVNGLLVQMDMPPLDALPAEAQADRPKGGFFEVFSPEFRGRTVLIWLAFVAVMSTWYFIANWTPKILVDAGLSRDTSLSGGVILSLGGVIGGITVGWIATRIYVLKVGAVAMLGSIAGMVVFGSLPVAITPMLVVTFLIGFVLSGSMISMYAAVPDMYPVQIRNTALGWALGIGRLGAVLGPNLAGVMIQIGWDRFALYAAMSLPMLLAAFAAVSLTRSGVGATPAQ